MINIDNLLASYVGGDLVEYYKARATQEIASYLGIEADQQEIINKYSVAIVELGKHYKDLDRQGNTASRSQGGRSESYIIEHGFPSKVKNLLPKPRLRVRG